MAAGKTAGLFGGTGGGTPLPSSRPPATPPPPTGFRPPVAAAVAMLLLLPVIDRDDEADVELESSAFRFEAVGADAAAKDAEDLPPILLLPDGLTI